MFNGTSTELGNLGASDKQCYAVAERHKNAKGIGGMIYRMAIWPNPCFPKSGPKLPLYESDKMNCQIIDALQQGLPHPCIQKKKDRENQGKDNGDPFEYSDENGNDNGDNGDGGGLILATNGKRKVPGRLYTPTTEDESRKPATQPTQPDTAFSYGGGSPQERARELKQRLALAQQGFIQREARPVEMITGSGFTSTR